MYCIPHYPLGCLIPSIKRELALVCCPGLALDNAGLCRCICVCSSLRKCRPSSFYTNCIRIVWSCIEQEPQFRPLTQHFTRMDGLGLARFPRPPESNPMASALSSTQILGVLFVFIPFPVSVRRIPDRSNLGGKGVYAGLYHSGEVFVGGARRP